MRMKTQVMKVGEIIPNLEYEYQCPSLVQFRYRFSLVRCMPLWQIWASVILFQFWVQFQSHFGPVLGPFCTHSNPWELILIQFGHIWSHLVPFDSVWSHFVSFCPI